MSKVYVKQALVEQEMYRDQDNSHLGGLTVLWQWWEGGMGRDIGRLMSIGNTQLRIKRIVLID